MSEQTTTFRPPSPDRPRIDELGTILSIWAHPDDETYLAGGLMAAAAGAGQRVVCVTATAGEQGTDDPETWPPLRLGRVRRQEAAAAMAVLGVGDHRVLGMPDGALADHAAQGLAAVRRLLDEVDPDTIVTFGPDGATFHPDHIQVHRWVAEAWRQRSQRGRLLWSATTTHHLEAFQGLYETWGVYMTDERPTGVPPERTALRLVLDGDDLERKLDALRAMPTQTGDVFASMDLGVFASVVAEEAFVAAATTRTP